MHHAGTNRGAQLPELLPRALRDDQRSVRRAAVSALGSYDDSQAISHLLAALDDLDRDVAVRAGESLVRLGSFARAGASARAAVAETDAWPLERALVLESLGSA